MTDSRGALDITRQRLAISRELISRSRRHLRSAAAHLERSGAAIAAAQRLIDRHTRPRGRWAAVVVGHTAGLTCVGRADARQ